MTALRVVVAVLTFRRATDLVEGLPLVVEQARQLQSRVGREVFPTVLIVDNDPAGSAIPTIARLQHALEGGSILRYVCEPEPGIAAARNRAIDESSDADLLVFIDDDERPTEGWLFALVTTWLDEHSTAVMGRVVSEFEGQLDDWVAAGEFFRRRSMPTGTSITVAAAGNLLVDRRQLARLDVRFDDSLGLAAGEDSLFSQRLVRAGGRITWCEESVAIDRVPATRMTHRWVLDRARSHGNCETVVALRLADGAAGRAVVRVGAVGRAALRIVGGGVRYCLGQLTGQLRHQARGARTFQRGVGIGMGAIGLVEREYARIPNGVAS